METRTCRVCGQEKSADDFTIADKQTGKRRSACKPCEAERVRAYYATNEGYREATKARARLFEDPAAWAEHLRERAEQRATVPETRVCKRCQRELPMTQFSKHPRARHGRNTVCRDCKITEGKEKKESGQWPSFAPENQRAYRLLNNYGMTPDDYAAMLAAQDGKCALCGSTDPGSHPRHETLVVDHDHDTGVVRGLLCGECNVWLGNYETLLDRAGGAKLAAYLTRGKKARTA